VLTASEFNKRGIAELETASFRNRIVVIGSGPSSPYIAPVTAFSSELETHCGIVKGVDDYFWDFCERACSANPTAYYDVVSRCYGTGVPHWDARAYAHLLGIGFKSYVTLNYDDQLPRAFRDAHPDDFGDLFSVYPPRDGLQAAQPCDLCGHKRRLVAVHGYSDRANPDWARQIILKTSDYDLHYTSPGKNRFLYNWWKNLLTAHPCAFVGTSLREPGLSRVVEDLIKDGNTAFEQLDHIHLIDFPRLVDPPYYGPAGRTLRAFKQIPFDKLDSRFSGLLDILSHFSNIPIDSPSPGMAAPKPITVGDKYDF
jgi:hypothetical protein